MAHELTRKQRDEAMAKATPEDGVRLLAGLGAIDAFNLMLEHPHPEQVAALVPLENLYLMLHEMGTDDGLILLELASPEQVQGFVDIDCWAKDLLDIPKARTWMMLINETDDEHFLRHLNQLDLSLLVTFFGRHSVVHKFENLDDAIEFDGPGFLTPDNRYLVQYTCSVEQSKLINALVMRIYNLDQELFALLLEAIYWEYGAEVEEQAFQERSSRMDGRGFPDFFAALELMAAVDVEQFVPGKKIGSQFLADEPGAVMSSSTYLTHYEHPDSLLRRALAVDFPGREQVSVEIMGVANMAVVAARVPFFDLEKVRHLVARTDGYLSLGLEYRVGNDEERAREQLRTYRVIDLHKIGRSLVMTQARRAARLFRRIAIDPTSKAKLLIDGPEGDFVQGLLHHEPQQTGQHDALWSNQIEVDAAAAAIDAVDALARLMSDVFGFTPATARELDIAATNIPDTAELSYRVLFDTFFCHDLLGREPSLRPLSAADLRDLAALLVRVGDKLDLPAERHDEFADWLRATAGETDSALLMPIFDRFTRGLVAELARVDLEPRFRSEVLVALR